MESGWAALKLRELDEAIAACAGLWIEVTADRPTPTPGSTIQATLTAINRSQFPLTWLGPAGTALGYNQVRTRNLPLSVPADQPYSQPFWLAKPKEGSSYTIDRQEMRDRPDDPPYYTATFDIQAGSERVELRRPLHYRYVDPERGELVRPVEVVPPVAVTLSGAVFIFPNGKPQKVQAQVTSNAAKTAGEVRLEIEKGWKVDPPSRAFQLSDAGEQADLSFEVTPAPHAGGASVRAVAKVAGRQIASGMRVIGYPHIPTQITFPDAVARAESVTVTNLAKRVGYVMGSGDEVPKALGQLGCDVTLLGAGDLAERNFSEFDAVVIGVRAYNVRPDLRANHNRLMRYIQDGGTVVVQYNVAEGGPFGRDTGALSHIGPYPLKVGRERVTVEEATVKFPTPNHPLLLRPNKITEHDFEGWVQERGLYFASEWDKQYEPVFETHDPGEKPLPGGTLYARYSKGVYIFTAYAWFRQLPAGVPGAYRLFANMISAGKTARP